MSKFFLCVLSVLFVAACSDAKRETEAEYNARARVADVEAADGTIARIPDIGEPVIIDGMPSLPNHPLQRFFNPWGEPALKYIGKVEVYCDPNHTAYTRATCQSAVDRAIRIGASIGIKLTFDDLVNPTYFAMKSWVWQAKRKHESDYRATLPRRGQLTAMGEYKKEFSAKEMLLMEGMDDK